MTARSATAAPPIATRRLLHRSRHADTVLATVAGRDVVVKRVRADLAEGLPAGPDDDLLERRERAANRVLREGWTLRRLEHDSIVRCLDIRAEEGAMVLELVPGRTIREELRQRRRMPYREAARIGAQLADALEHLHGRWMLHRDVKPANVMYDGRRAVLVDFHLACDPGPMRGGAGTRLFAAPEQVRGGLVGPSADCWGLGIVLYRALTGRLPFHATEGHPQLQETAPPVLDRLAESRFDGDRERAAAEVPPLLAGLVDEMLAPDPAARPSTAEVRDCCLTHAG